MLQPLDPTGGLSFPRLPLPPLFYNPGYGFGKRDVERLETGEFNIGEGVT